jgi:prepilin-type N-terminal cleavage/methylation domain-containing protein
MAARPTERGFTLIEVMITVAIIAILATIVVPMFTAETLKSKANIEVTAVFATLASRQEQYKLDNGVYLATAQCPTAAPNGTERPLNACVTTGQPWQPLSVLLPQDQAYCSYTTVIGNGTGTNNPLGFTFTSPPMRWYYMTAICDMDNDGTQAVYFQSSVEATIQKTNEGE